MTATTCLNKLNKDRLVLFCVLDDGSALAHVDRGFAQNARLLIKIVCRFVNDFDLKSQTIKLSIGSIGEFRSANFYRWINAEITVEFLA